MVISLVICLVFSSLATAAEIKFVVAEKRSSSNTRDLAEGDTISTVGTVGVCGERICRTRTVLDSQKKKVDRYLSLSDRSVTIKVETEGEASQTINFSHSDILSTMSTVQAYNLSERTETVLDGKKCRIVTVSDQFKVKTDLCFIENFSQDFKKMPNIEAVIGAMNETISLHQGLEKIKEVDFKKSLIVSSETDTSVGGKKYFRKIKFQSFKLKD